MRYVGKSTSIAAYGSDDVERTWLPEVSTHSYS